jgi:hypothetical protein
MIEYLPLYKKRETIQKYKHACIPYLCPVMLGAALGICQQERHHQMQALKAPEL